MATLLLAAGTAHTSGIASLNSPSLRNWLRESEDWAILFSHPDDFVRYDLEMDRWLIVTRRAFAERHVRPLSLTPSHDSERGWVTQVSGDSRTVLLEDPARQHFGPVDLQTPVLREEIERVQRRFVMIIDNALRKQKLFTYETLSNLPSPLEFLGWAEGLRAKQSAPELPGKSDASPCVSHRRVRWLRAPDSDCGRRPWPDIAHGRPDRRSSPAYRPHGTS
ncbi:MAG TPA: hypothetical protein VHB68_02280 [Steroidobacteraceae bacterium]|nr:hypothetical protein [Steroidobacteraceae bacterium]